MHTLSRSIVIHYENHWKKQQILYHSMSYTSFRKSLTLYNVLEQHKNNLVKFNDFWMLNEDIPVLGTEINKQKRQDVHN